MVVTETDTMLGQRHIVAWVEEGEGYCKLFETRTAAHREYHRKQIASGVTQCYIGRVAWDHIQIELAGGDE